MLVSQLLLRLRPGPGLIHRRRRRGRSRYKTVGWGSLLCRSLCRTCPSGATPRVVAVAEQRTRCSCSAPMVHGPLAIGAKTHNLVPITTSDGRACALSCSRRDIGQHAAHRLDATAPVSHSPGRNEPSRPAPSPTAGPSPHGRASTVGSLSARPARRPHARPRCRAGSTGCARNAISAPIATGLDCEGTAISVAAVPFRAAAAPLGASSDGTATGPTASRALNQCRAAAPAGPRSAWVGRTCAVRARVDVELMRGDASTVTVSSGSSLCRWLSARAAPGRAARRRPPGPCRSLRRRRWRAPLQGACRRC